MHQRYVINLTEEERLGLEDLLSRKPLSALKAQRVRVVLRADEGLTDEEVADELDVGVATVGRIRKRVVLEGIQAALERRVQRGPSRPPALDGRAEAYLVQVACSTPPQGATRWTLNMLTDRLVELNVVDTISRSTVHRRLKKMTSSLGQ